MSICPVCKRECRDDYCIFCMRPITAAETTKRSARRYDDICDVPARTRKPFTLKRLSFILFMYNLIITVLGISAILLDIYVF